MASEGPIEISDNSGDSNPKISKRKAKIDKYRGYFRDQVEIRLNELKAMISSDGHSPNEILVQKARKQASSKNTKFPEKRSQYIGVSKNGKNWQSLVVIKKDKLYISTCKSEETASIIFDFYSILHSSAEAKTNRPYTIGEAIQVSKVIS